MEQELWSVVPEDYGTAYQQHLLEQYKLYVEMTDRVSARRATVQNFLLSVNVLLLSGFGFLASDDGLAAWEYVIPIAGFVVCIVWYILIYTFRIISDKKLEVVRSLEQRLPVAPFIVERAKLGGDKTEDYLLLTHVEPFIPAVFAALYLALIGAAIFDAAA